jgi:hypothetical protein
LHCQIPQATYLQRCEPRLLSVWASDSLIPLPSLLTPFLPCLALPCHALPCSWDVLALADHFRIRVQRVMAIIALKDKEKQAKEAGEPLNTELAGAAAVTAGA